MFAAAKRLLDFLKYQYWPQKSTIILWCSYLCYASAKEYGQSSLAASHTIHNSFKPQITALLTIRSRASVPIQCAWQMILKCETLPVRLFVSWVHTVYVTLSEDNQPMLPGVSQNVGCTLLVSNPTSHLLSQPWSLQFVSAAALLHRRAWEGWDAAWHESRQHASRGGGSLSVHTHPHTVILYTSLYEALSSSHSHTHTHTHNAAHTQTPCGGFGNPSSDPNVSSQSRSKAHHHRLLLNPRGRVPFLPVCSSRD